MASNTTNYGWTKPDYEDDADIMVINGTIDSIDADLHTINETLSAINTAFPMMMRRGTATMNSESGFGFDDIHETIYYRYTASAVGNPVASAYGIIITFAFTSYIVQILFSNTSSTNCELRYRFSADTGTTWRAWHLVSATAQS